MKIIIAIDDSEFSQAALDSASKRFRHETCEFLLLSVAQPLMTDLGGMVLESDRLYHQDLLTQAEQELKQKLPEHKVSSCLREGQAADEIVQVAIDWQADHIIIGSHGRRGLDRLILGSVAESVVNKSPCSVEVIKIKHASPDSAPIRAIELQH